ncbi:MAG: glutamate--tRNA ligase [Leptolyngbya sp. PLA1]|nr:glutamate--tRNA ligase [Leptolyngbya sp. PLA1]
MSASPVVTRFAPSPTGHLHVGGARSALFCWAYAKNQGGRFMLRIEDTDAARSSDDSARGIMEDLAWLGIEWDDGPVLSLADGRTVGGDARGVGPYFQARRVSLYNRCAEQLVKAGRAYPAFETPEVIDAQRREAVAAKKTYRYPRPEEIEPGRFNDALKARWDRALAGESHVLRFVAPAHEIIVQDRVLGAVKIAAGELDDFVIRKADGFPTYHFAVVVDDETMGVSHVMRAQEHLANTPRHVALQQALGFRTPIYAHMPLIMNMDNSKMSKRDKAKAARAKLQERVSKGLTPAAAAAALELPESEVASFLAKDNDSLAVAERIARVYDVTLPEIEVCDFRAAGYLPEAMCNFLGLLGWNPGMKSPDGKDLEKFDLAFLRQHFSIERIGRTNSKFDRLKLLAFNADAIAALPDAEFAARWRHWCEEFEPALVRAVPTDRWPWLARAVKARARTLRDGAKAAAFALLDDASYTLDQGAVAKHLQSAGGAGLRLLADARARLAAAEPFEPEVLHGVLEQMAQQNGGMGLVAQPIRVAIAGVAVSPPLPESLAVLGKARVLARIDRCIGLAST